MILVISDICEDLTKDDLKFYMFMRHGKIIEPNISAASQRIWDKVIATFAMIFILLMIMTLIFLATLVLEV